MGYLGVKPTSTLSCLTDGNLLILKISRQGLGEYTFIESRNLSRTSSARRSPLMNVIFQILTLYFANI